MSFVTSTAAGILIRVKAVPGASRNEIAGVLEAPGGDRLKVRVSAPPEGGKANAAICETLATALRVKARDVVVQSGHGSAEKVFLVTDTDLSADVIEARLLQRR